MKADQKMVELRRPRGRPRLYDQPMETVQTRLPLDRYARLCQIATQQGKDVAEVVRDVLILRLT